jgi:prolyl 4-hydroxylase
VAKESPSAPVAAAESEERFLSSARPLPKSVYARADQLVNVPGFPRSPPLVLSATRPKAYLFRNFLTEEECRHLIALAKAQLAPSTVVADGGKKSTKSGIRTSAGMFLTKGQTPTVRMVEERVAAAVGLPEENGEGMQILRYEHGQKYDPHYDYFHDKINPSPNRGGQRMATMLIYLKDTEEGGETIFPNAKKPEGFHDGEKDGAFSDCAKRGLPVKSKRGDAVLFWSLTSDYKLDEGSLHGACPVLRGEKWTAVKWIRVAKFDGRFTGELPMPSLTRGDRAAVDATARCVDEWDECAEWARKGWCERNPEFMTGVNGARDSKGPACAVSCGAPCPPLPPGSA